MGGGPRAAHLVAGPALDVEGTRVEARHHLVATGASPWTPPISGLPAPGHLTSTSAVALERVPASAVVAGGSAVGPGDGPALGHLGVQVTPGEARPRLAPAEEPEISDALAQVPADDGIEVLPCAPITSVESRGTSTTVRRGGAARRELLTDSLLMATGRRPDTEGLGPEAVGVQRGALGEVRAGCSSEDDPSADLGHSGGHGCAPVRGSRRGARDPRRSQRLRCSRTHDRAGSPAASDIHEPAIAAVGLTHAEVTAAGIACGCRVLSLAFVPRATVARDTRGLVKIVAGSGHRQIRWRPSAGGERRGGCARRHVRSGGEADRRPAGACLVPIPQHGRGAEARRPVVPPRRVQALLRRRVSPPPGPSLPAPTGSRPASPARHPGTACLLVAWEWAITTSPAACSAARRARAGTAGLRGHTGAIQPRRGAVPSRMARPNRWRPCGRGRGLQASPRRALRLVSRMGRATRASRGRSSPPPRPRATGPLRSAPGRVGFRPAPVCVRAPASALRYCRGG